MDLDLKNILSNTELSRQEKVLLILASDDSSEKHVKEIREKAISHGLREASKWNISQILKDLGGACVRMPGGWATTSQGLSSLEKLGFSESKPIKDHKPVLRKYASEVGSHEVRNFLEEVIDALEFRLLRAAVVLSWIGAVSVLYEIVVKHYLSNFNNEASRRLPKWKAARTSDDLCRMKEYDFLQIITTISIIGKNTKDELEQCLKLRNTCGHPSSHIVGEHRVSSHIETLTLNVFAKFKI